MLDTKTPPLLADRSASSATELLGRARELVHRKAG